ncbi:MAG: GNAT family N-acetyltransferase [Hyphomicrobium sp.]|uniref:GNAT family N-acetyltransferase n=1 Tax=Hyphomicrobium sp. TaxID=82 RepID=UPI0025C2EB7F|nr:GNAT family N-acetyltransferase [Hyphomicrobium sp.]MBZ0211508.1 GNAT family N-acetyltransferase [Hyphomicrobium sp.]
MRSTSAARLPRIADEPAAHATPAVRPQQPPEPCRYDVVTARTEFDALAPEWNELFARAGRSTQLFQTFNWSWHWCNHYLGKSPAEGPALALLIARRSGKLVMVWPLVTERIAGLLQLTWMGAPVSQYGDVLVDDVPDRAALMRAAWAHVVGTVKPDVVRLTRVRADAAIAPLITELGGIATQRLAAPYLDLSSAPDFETYMQRHSGRSRKKMRAAARKLAQLGTVEFVRRSGGHEASEMVAAAIDAKRRQLVERGIISPALADPRMQRFFADAADGSGHPAGVIVYALEINGDKTAIDVLVGCKDRIATHIFAYDPKYAKDRVGAHLLERTIAQSFADGCPTFDLLAPADPYKLQWADGTVDVTDWAIPVSMKGAAYTRLYLRALRPLLKALLNSLPTPLSRVLAERYARLKSLS